MITCEYYDQGKHHDSLKTDTWETLEGQPLCKREEGRQRKKEEMEEREGIQKVRGSKKG